MANKIVVIGSLNMDLVGCAPRIPVVGETIVGHKYFSEPGGKGANQAYAAAKLGGRVAMLGVCSVNVRSGTISSSSFAQKSGCYTFCSDAGEREGYKMSESAQPQQQMQIKADGER